MLVDALGEPLNTRHLRRHAYRLMGELDMRQVRLHDARRSWITYLAASGVPDVEDLRPAAAAWDAFHSADGHAA